MTRDYDDRTIHSPRPRQGQGCFIAAFIMGVVSVVVAILWAGWP